MSLSSPRDFRDIWSAPLVPVAAALTIGIVADRFGHLSLAVSMPIALLALIGWTLAIRTQPRIALAFLWMTALALGAVYHHVRIRSVADDDVRHLATLAGTPLYLEGELASAPLFLAPDEDSLERGFAVHGTTRGLLQVRRVTRPDGQGRAVSGLVQMTVPTRLREQVYVGDRVRVLGRLQAPEGPGNPGEFDLARFQHDQGIGGILRVSEQSDGVLLLERSWIGSLRGWLSALRAWGMRTIDEALPTQAALGQALLLGEGSALGTRGWDKYFRTGVIHVLAISGQHLVVLATFLWFILRRPWWSRRTTAIIIAMVLVGYALLTGGRPPVMRSAWVVVVATFGIVLRRPVSVANAFACAWIGVALFNPADIFQIGCQLSFLAVAALVWGVRIPAPDQLDRLEMEQRSWPVTVLLTGMRWLMWQYMVTLIVWLAVAPLVASNLHIVSPIALLIGPPLVWLTSLALISGFLLLVFAPFGAWLMPVFAWPTEKLLGGCEAIVDWALKQPGAYFFVADIPNWWVYVFYAGLFVALWAPALPRPRWLLPALGSAWLVLGLMFALGWLRPREDRCTFVSVGHGGCVVLETQDGRVAVYDVGSKRGSGVTIWQIAPFLWSRGIRRIDEVILSHADSDHISGLPDLVDRFAVGRVVHTPTLEDRRSPPVHRLLKAIERHDIPTTIVQRDDRWELGMMAFHVLHPPAEGPAGKENERSLVLHVRLAGMSLLLTGDLEGAGLPMVLSQRAPPIDVMQAPHHGSPSARPRELAVWARPRAVISSQALAPGKSVHAEPYDALGIPFLTTAESGAITLRPDTEGVKIEAFRK